MSILWLFHSERVVFTWYPAGHISSFICCKSGACLWQRVESVEHQRSFCRGEGVWVGKCGKGREVVWEVAADSGGEVDGQMEMLFSVADGAKARLGMVAHAYI